jgi:glutamate-ammonia-ligase adenylyltransferase
MRALIAEAKGDADPWDLKLVAGGLVDIEFMAQYLVLRHAHSVPDVLRTATAEVIAAAGGLGLLEAGDSECLLAAHRLYSGVTQILRLALDDDADPREASVAVKRRLAKVADLPGMNALENDLAERRVEVRGIFERVLGA